MKRNFAYRRWYVLKKNVLKKKKIQFFSRARNLKNADDALRVHKKKITIFFWFDMPCVFQN